MNNSCTEVDFKYVDEKENYIRVKISSRIKGILSSNTKKNLFLNIMIQNCISTLIPVMVNTLGITYIMHMSTSISISKSIKSLLSSK